LGPHTKKVLSNGGQPEVFLRARGAKKMCGPNLRSHKANDCKKVMSDAGHTKNTMPPPKKNTHTQKLHNGEKGGEGGKEGMPVALGVLVEDGQGVARPGVRGGGGGRGDRVSRERKEVGVGNVP